MLHLALTLLALTAVPKVQHGLPHRVHKESILYPSTIPPVPKFCAALNSVQLLTKSTKHACINGDATQDSSADLTFSTVGSPVVQTRQFAPTGVPNATTSRTIITSSAYYQTAAVPSPTTGDWWACGFGIDDPPLQSEFLTGQSNAWSLEATGAGYGAYVQTGGVTHNASGGAFTTSSDHLVCVTYHYVGSGSVNVATVYIDGVNGGSASNEPPVPTVTAAIQAGTVGTSTGIARLRGAAFGTGYLPTSAEMKHLAGMLLPVPAASTGVPIADTRDTSDWVTTPDGSMAVLSPSIAGAVGVVTSDWRTSGIMCSPTRLNEIKYSDDPQFWTSTAGISIGNNAYYDLDGGKTADQINAYQTGSPEILSSKVTANGDAYTASWYVQAASGTQTFQWGVYDATSLTWLGPGLTTVTATTTWQHLVMTIPSTTNNDQIQLAMYPDTTSSDGSGGVITIAAQFEKGSIALPRCHSEGSATQCTGDKPTTPKPAWLAATEGCVRMCFTPTFTGANPLSSILALMSANTSGTARLLYIPASAQSVAISDGTHTAVVNTTFTKGTRQCYRASWSASNGKLTVTDLTSKTTATATGFTTMGAFATDLDLCHENGSYQPLGSTIDTIEIESASGACN